MAKQKKVPYYLNEDGSIKLLKVVERLPDGTRILEGGWKILPSKVIQADGSLRRLDEYTKEEYEEWNKKLMERVGNVMSRFYNSQA